MASPADRKKRRFEPSQEPVSQASSSEGVCSSAQPCDWLDAPAAIHPAAGAGKSAAASAAPGGRLRVQLRFALSGAVIGYVSLGNQDSVAVLYGEARRLTNSDPAVHCIRLFLADTSELPSRGFLDEVAPQLEDGAVVSVTRFFAPLVVTIWGATANIWSTASGERVRVLKGHGGDVMSASFSPDSRFIVTASEDGLAKIWDCMTAKCQRTLNVGGNQGGEYFDRVYSAMFSNTGDIIATVSENASVSFWDVEGGQRLHSFQCGPEGSYVAAAFLGDGRHLATVCSDDVISTVKAYIWCIDSGRCVRSLEDTVHAPQAAQGDVTCIACADDGERLATNNGDGFIRLWDLHSGLCTLAWRLPIPESHDLGVIASGVTDTDSSDEDSGPLVTSMAFSPDSQLLAVAREVAELWDPAENSTMHCFADPYERVTWVDFLYSRDTLLIGSTKGGGETQIRCLQTGALIHAFKGRIRGQRCHAIPEHGFRHDDA